MPLLAGVVLGPAEPHALLDQVQQGRPRQRRHRQDLARPALRVSSNHSSNGNNSINSVITCNSNSNNSAITGNKGVIIVK